MTELGLRIQEALTNYNFAAILLSLGILAFCVIIELIFLPFRQTSLCKIVRPTRSSSTDLIIGSFYLFGVFSIAKAIIFFEVAAPVRLPYDIAEKIPSIWLRFLIYFVIVDFFNYWIHRIMHEVEFLWQIHKFHHAATDFIIITGNRVHPIEKLFSRSIIFIPLSFIGAPAEMYLGVLIVIEFIDKMQHSMVNWQWGWIGRYLIFSPVGHRIHHSEEEEHWDKNYGDILVIWDKLFGTYYYGSNINEKIGVTENWLNRKGIVYDLIKSTQLSWIAFRNSIQSSKWKANHNSDGRS
jgi:sterol desaturase/sphingolipid hydroxylase (fatty acid hydroxylase superfamily)